MQEGFKKISLSSEEEEATITLNTRADPPSLEVLCKSLKRDRQFWGSFRLGELGALCQTLFTGVEQLFLYISENAEEVELARGQVTVRLNYLGQSRPLTFPLHRMVMSSLEQQARLESRLALLEAENAGLRTQGGRSSCKLTLGGLVVESLNLLSYQLVDQCRIKPKAGRIARELFLNSAQNILPASGLWHFRVFLTGCLPTGQLEIGVRNVGMSKASVELVGEGFGEGDMATVMLQMELKTMVVQRNGVNTCRTCWKQVEGELLLAVRAEGVQLWTDLLMGDHQVDWTPEPQLE